MYHALIPTVYHGKTVDWSLEIDKDYVTKKVTIAKRKDERLLFLILVT
jgi:hypothetical protein